MFNKTRKIPNKVYPVQSIWVLGRNENQEKARGNRIQPRLQPGWIDFSPIVSRHRLDVGNEVCVSNSPDEALRRCYLEPGSI
jgi:hypothetical protein